MIETTTNPTLRAIADQAHHQRSLAPWRMIEAIRSLPALLLAGHAEGAAPKSGPANSIACSA